MSTFTLNVTIDTDNAAFNDNPDELLIALDRIVRTIAADHGDPTTLGAAFPIIDSNGNTVGNYRWEHR